MRKQKNKKMILLVAIIAVAAVGAALYVKHNQATKPADTKVHAGPASDKDQQASASEKKSTATSSSTNNQVSTPNHPVSSSLAKPIGPNNNTSRVSLSGASGMESTCRSVPGASCYIQATKGSQVITVSDTKTIGSDPTSDGVVFDWDANKLSVGTWSIRAVASKDGSSASSDPQSLEVTQ